MYAFSLTLMPSSNNLRRAGMYVLDGTVQPARLSVLGIKAFLKLTAPKENKINYNHPKAIATISQKSCGKI